jgi:hypothetical protein
MPNADSIHPPHAMAYHGTTDEESKILWLEGRLRSGVPICLGLSSAREQSRLACEAAKIEQGGILTIRLMPDCAKIVDGRLHSTMPLEITHIEQIDFGQQFRGKSKSTQE